MEKVFTSLFSFGLSIWLTAFISIELYNQRYNLQQIWIFRFFYRKTFELKLKVFFRNENFDQGFWSLIVCLIGALSETVFGLASFVTCLHYSDVVERLQLYSEVKQLAEEYPGQRFTHWQVGPWTKCSGTVLDTSAKAQPLSGAWIPYPEYYGQYLSSWSSSKDVRKKKKRRKSGGGSGLFSSSLIF